MESRTGAPAWSHARPACGSRPVDEVLRAQVAVVGAGPAGIAAAVRASEAGAEVLLVDEAAAPGGQIWRQGAASPPSPARRWLDRLARTGAKRLRAAAVFSLSPRRLRLETPGGATDLEWETLVVATGARELFLPFPGWTLPNVIGAGAAQSLVKSGASMRGRRAVVAGSGPLLLAAASTLAKAGARVRTIAEQAPPARVRRFARDVVGRPGKLLEAARYRAAAFPARYRPGVWIAAALGDDRVRQVVLTDGDRVWTEWCDLVCCGWGLVPGVELAAHLGCSIVRGRVVVDEAQETSVAGIYAAGETTGIGGVDLALAEGEAAGMAAAGRRDDAIANLRKRRSLARFATALEEAFALRPEVLGLSGPDTLICRCEDVALGSLERSWSARQAKLYTRAGMGPCQGKVCGPALEMLLGWEPDRVRPPLRPVPLGALAGIGESVTASQGAGRPGEEERS
jgi:NADPH-dependent 2,4-dienoyl-CoA reductase/sulfur reductase-like enzyme